MRRFADRPAAICGALAAVAVLGCGGSVASTAVPRATSPARASAAAGARSFDWTRFGFDAARSGDAPRATGITAANVGSLRARHVRLPGTVDSSPIVLAGVRVKGRRRDVAFVTTTYGRTLAIDLARGAILWQYRPPSLDSFEGTARITNTTPVADPSRRFLYAATPDGRVRKLLVANGHEVRSARWPAVVTRDATHEKLAAALNLSGGWVIATTGGYIGDAPPYQGHVAAIDRSTGRVAHVFNSLCADRHALILPRTCASSDSAIWARAGAVVEPGSHRLLIATGNGPWNGGSDWGDSVLELSSDASRLLHTYTPRDQRQLEASDTDLGSSAPALLPPSGGRRLAIEGGKDGRLRLLDLERLGGTTAGPGPHLGGELQTISTPGAAQLFSQPAIARIGGRDFAFVSTDSGTAAYALSGGRLRVAWSSSTPGTSPVLAGGLLYVYDFVHGAVVVFRPASSHPVAHLRVGSGHWNSPVVDGGRVVVPEGNANDHARSGSLTILHLRGR